MQVASSSGWLQNKQLSLFGVMRVHRAAGDIPTWSRCEIQKQNIKLSKDNGMEGGDDRETMGDHLLMECMGEKSDVWILFFVLLLLRVQ